MKQLSLLIKPASSLCNLKCKYCFYTNVSDYREINCYGIMQNKVMQEVIKAAFCDIEPEGHITFAFQGGEPTIAGLDFFRSFVSSVKQYAKTKRVNIDYAIQTNGILIDEQWNAFLKENRFLVGLSIDGPAIYHNKNRVDTNNKGTIKRVSDVARLFQKSGVSYNILCVLSKDNARDPEKLWNYFLDHNYHYIQFIPCIPEFTREDDEFSLNPKLFHDFYAALFSLWSHELNKGNFISIKLFDDLINMLVFRKLTSCGLNGNCSLQYIVEADASVYPCDFYALDEYRLGNITVDTLETIRNRYCTSSFHEMRREFPEECKSCKYVKICQGGCVRLRNSMYIKNDYCGFRNLLDDIGEPLIQMALRIIQ